MPRTSVHLLAAALLALALATIPRPAAAVWPSNPLVNVPLCTATNDQVSPTIVSDGAGGAIVTWEDLRSGTSDIYAQRISATGAALWTANGVGLCRAAGEQSAPTITSDGAGGAIVTWLDYRGGATSDIYAQRISSTGTVRWLANGVALCTAALDQTDPKIVSDGSGGAIVTWTDSRSGTADIYAQRISGTSTVEWSANGVFLCKGAGDQVSPKIVSDGSGGAIVTWTDSRSGTSDIYAQQISAAGTVQWLANGVALCTATGDQTYPTIVSDDAGGAIVSWMDSRSGASDDIYAQRVSATGTVQWAADGVPLCTSSGDQAVPRIVADGVGGAIVAWWDQRDSSYDIYALRISAAGTVQWTANGVALCTAAGTQFLTTITSDGSGGAVVAWYDYRGGVQADIYARRVSASGTPEWTADGVALCTTLDNQWYPAVASDDAGGAIVTWQDQRSGDGDIYVQRVDQFGYLRSGEPSILSVRDLPGDQGGHVRIEWSASYLDTFPRLAIGAYGIWRQVTESAAAKAVARGASWAGSDPEECVTAGVFRIDQTQSQTTYWEGVGSVLARGEPWYTYVAETFQDSSAAGNPPTTFMVDAHGAWVPGFWDSAPDSGYSVDNLAPLTPAPFTGEYAAGTATLHWAASAAADLAEYRLYRGNSADFVPGPANLVAAQPDTGYVDAAGAPSFYKLCAVDVHGNTSGFSTLLPSGTADVPGAVLPRAVFLAPPAPNPARGATTLRFGLPREARVELALYDQQGRRVRALLSGTQPAGERTIAWDGAGDNGRALPAGLYFVRLTTEGRTFVSRLAVIH
jgi:hypothetical protein